MYNYEMNVEYLCNGHIMEQFQMVRPAVDNTPEILKPNLQFALSKMLEEIPRMELGDVLRIKQNRHRIDYFLSNGNQVAIFVKVVPVPNVKLEVPPVCEDEEIEVRVSLNVNVKVSELALSRDPVKALSYAIQEGNYQLNGDGYVREEELLETGTQFHPSVDVNDMIIFYGLEVKK